MGHFIQVSWSLLQVLIVHQGGERSVEISSDLEGDALVSLILPAFQEAFAGLELPQRDAALEYGGEARKWQSLFTSLG